MMPYNEGNRRNEEKKRRCSMIRCSSKEDKSMELTCVERQVSSGFGGIWGGLRSSGLEETPHFQFQVLSSRQPGRP